MAKRIRAQRDSRQAWQSLPVLAACLATFISDSVRITTTPMSGLVGRYLADDAFYYYVLAQNFPIPQFNADSPTTGFHPLYWLVASPVFALAPDQLAIRLSIGLTSAVHIGAGFLLFRFVGRRHNSAVASLTAVIWICHPGIRSLALMGVETSIVAFAIIALLLALDHPVTTRRAMVVGGLVGVTFLARTDSVILTVPTVVLWLLKHPGRNRALLVVGGCAAVVAAPWMLYLALNGGISPDSAEALRTVHDAIGTSMAALTTVPEFLATHTATVVGPLGELGPVPWVQLAAVAAVVTVARPTLQVREWAILAGALAVHVAQASRLGGLREWYAVYWTIALFTVVAPRVSLGVQRLVPGRSTPWVVLLAFGLAAVPTRQWFPQETDKYRAGLIAADLVGDARVAAFNAGIYQYVMPHDVLNLDGVVNPDVHPHLENRTLCLYLRKKRVDWLIDSPNGLSKLRVFAPEVPTYGARELSSSWEAADLQFLLRIDTSRCTSP